MCGASGSDRQLAPVGDELGPRDVGRVVRGEERDQGAPSSGLPNRCIGMDAAAIWLRSSSGTVSMSILVRMPPGCTELTRMLFAPYSAATAFVMPRTANLALV